MPEFAWVLLFVFFLMLFACCGGPPARCRDSMELVTGTVPSQCHVRASSEVLERDGRVYLRCVCPVGG